MKNGASGRIFIGGLIIILGTLLFLDQLNIPGIGRVFGIFWPTVIVFLGIFLILKNLRNPIAGLIILTVGIFLQIEALGLIAFSIWNLWPIFLIIIGLSILFSWKPASRFEKSNLEYLNSTAVFWGEELKINSDNFKGGTVTTIFGGVSIDLTEAKISSDNAEINITCIFGGIELKLPRDICVINNAVGIFGGISDKSRLMPNSSKKPTLTVSGTAIFGGVDIK